MNESVKSFIEKCASEMPELVHASNILAKEDDDGGKRLRVQSSALDRISVEYKKYLQANLSLIGYSYDVVQRRVRLLNGYYNFIHDQGYDNTFKSQGKFRSTILEEFVFLLFKDFVQEKNTNLLRTLRQEKEKAFADLKNDGRKKLNGEIRFLNDTIDKLKEMEKNPSGLISCGYTKAYTNLFFSADKFDSFAMTPSIKANEKDQDFAIYKELKVSVSDFLGMKLESATIRVPVIAVECKTYLDKTMLEGAIATAEKEKMGFPCALFFVVTEFYDVAYESDPTYSQIDQIFVLRKSRRKKGNKPMWQDIDPEVVWVFVARVLDHLKHKVWSGTVKGLESGQIIAMRRMNKEDFSDMKNGQ